MAVGANGWVLANFDWLFSLMPFCAVVLVGWVWLSPLGKVRIGGANAKPILNRRRWFSITLCTSIAIGILFWGAAEPMFHTSAPPAFLKAEAFAPETEVFALSTLLLHWTVTPYAIYATIALAFALAHFNLQRDYSLSAIFSVFSDRFVTGRAAQLIDGVALYALVAGVAAALGVGVMTVAGGLEVVFGFDDTLILRFFITTLIVTLFIISSVSGIQRGIRYLSLLNVGVFFFFVAFVFVAGPTRAILDQAAQAIGQYVVTFPAASLSLGERGNDPWTQDWTVFYFANWLAWAPITALFLGRISVGYTVREFLTFNMLAPAGFGALWMMVFGGAAIELNAARALSDALTALGPEAVIYTLFDALPLVRLVAPIFILSTVISFVTAMDSNTFSIASVCLKGGIENATGVKIFWGLLMGASAFIMTSATGIDGVRILSNLGGLPSLVILIAASSALIMMRMRYLSQLTSL